MHAPDPAPARFALARGCYIRVYVCVWVYGVQRAVVEEWEKVFAARRELEIKPREPVRGTRNSSREITHSFANNFAYTFTRRTSLSPAAAAAFFFFTFLHRKFNDFSGVLVIAFEEVVSRAPSEFINRRACVINEN